jgi:ribulose-phosphate 3-epimerase
MISNPAEFIDRYIDAGADLVTIHAEAIDDAAPLLAQIRDRGAAAGLALNPPTPLDAIVPFVDLCDVVLVMSVMPGFGGQRFDEAALAKLRALRRQRADQGRSDLFFQVDGGLNEGTIGDCAAAGADLLVVGSAIFQSDDYAERIDRLTRQASDAAASSEKLL